MFLQSFIAIGLCVMISNFGAASRLPIFNINPGIPTTLGENVTKNEFPWLVWFSVDLPNNKSRFCTGSIIDLDMILTTASCVLNSTKPITIVAGDHSLKEIEGTEQNVTSREIIIHENFGTNKTYHLSNDIALIRLASNLTQTSAVQPALLPNEDCVGLDCLAFIGVAAGWGVANGSNDEGSLSDVLLKAYVPSYSCILSNVKPSPSINNTCVDLGQFGGYQGDMGGPLVYENRTVITAILSYAGNSQVPFLPEPRRTGIYTLIFPYIDWILKNGGPLPPPTTTTTPATTTTGGSSLIGLSSGLSSIFLAFFFKLFRDTI